LTQKCWKIFVENEEKNAVFTYPCFKVEDNPRHRKEDRIVVKMGDINEEFVKCIALCILSDRYNPVSVKQPDIATTAFTSRDVPAENSAIGKKIDSKLDTPQKPEHQSKKPRLDNADIENIDPLNYNPEVNSSYISGYDIDKTPIRKVIRVYNQDQIDELLKLIENESNP
jgi:hypothetical protein